MFRYGLNGACAEFHTLPLQLQAAIIMAAHHENAHASPMVDVHALIFDKVTAPLVTYSTVEVHYTNGRMVQMTLFAEVYDGDRGGVAREVRRAAGEPPLAKRKKSAATDYKCVTIVRQDPGGGGGGTVKNHSAKALFGPYMSIIFCKDRPLTVNNNLFLE
jgi:hypothetical protein